MAKTAFSTSDALTKKAWEEKLFRDAKKESYFSRFMGEDDGKLVQVKTDLEKDYGDELTFGIVMRLLGGGVVSGQTLEGNEEKLTAYNCKVALEQYRHATRDDGKMSRQRAMFDITATAASRLQDWGSEKIDLLSFDALGIGVNASGSNSKIFYTTSAGLLSTGTLGTATAAVTVADSKLTPSFIQALRAWAKTGGARSYVPLRPVRVDGKDYYVLIAHPDCLYDLKQNSTWQAYQRDAAERGSSNPIFTGMVGVLDGVVIHEHENCATFTTGGSGNNVPYAKCAFMGAQSLVWAWGQREEVVKKKFDYDNEEGRAWGIVAGVKAPLFNSLSYGSVEVILARSNIAGA